jgi:hypothetical protein
MTILSKPVLQSVTQTNSTTIVLHFDQAMGLGDGNIIVSDGYSQSYLSGGSLRQRLIGATDARQIGVVEGDNAGGDDGQVSFSGNNATITFSTALKAGLGYSITMGDGTLYSNAGGDEGGFGISSPTLFKFTASGTVTAPSAPSAVAGAAIHFIDNGASSTDYITSIGAQTVTGTYTGTLGSNDFVQVSLDNGASWHKATTSGNNWSYTGGIETANLVSVGGGLGGTLLARVSNTSALSTATASHSYVYTGVAANTAALTGHAVSLSAGSDTGSLDDDGITQAATSVEVNVQGLHGFHVGDTVRILDTSNGGAIVGHYVIETGDLLYGSGDYIAVNFNNPNFRTSLSVELDAPLSAGTHSLVAVMVDTAGLVSSAVSSAGSITVDHTAPILSSSAPVEEATSVSVNLDRLEITFDEDVAVENGTIVTITDTNNPNSFQEVTLYSSDVVGNKLTINLNEALNSNTHYEVKGAIVSDLAGNVGVTGDAALLHFNTGTQPVQPATPSFSIIDTAPASDSVDSPRHSDNVTGDPMIHVDGVTSGEWYYRLSSSGNWVLGDNTHSFQLAVLPGDHDGLTYAANAVQVKQVENGIDSEIYSNSTAITVIVPGPTALQDVDQTSGFNNGGTALTGHMHDSTDLPNEIVEVTLDGGAHWLAATTTLDGSGSFNWSLDLGSSGSTLGDAVGVRVVDQTGTPGAFPYHGMLTHYYLADDDATFTDSSGVAIVFGGAGSDTITLGSNSYVTGGGGNDHIVTGTYSEVYTGAGNDTITAGAGSYVSAGDGNNSVTVTDGASSLVTGGGDDLIDLGTYFASVTSVDAGAGTDTLALSSSTAVSVEALVNVSGARGIDVLQLGANTIINLGANGEAVDTLSDANHLVINGNSSNSVQMGANWSFYSAGGGYVEYHAQDGAVVLVAIAMVPTA